MTANSVSSEEFHALRELEESLWKTDTRFDPVLMNQVFADDFFEFGRSGRKYTREEMILPASSGWTINATLPLPQFSVTPIDACTVLVTYVSETKNEDGEVLRSNRSSIWSRFDSRWRLRFHQGTPVA